MATAISIWPWRVSATTTARRAGSRTSGGWKFDQHVLSAAVGTDQRDHRRHQRRSASGHHGARQPGVGGSLVVPERRPRAASRRRCSGAQRIRIGDRAGSRWPTWIATATWTFFTATATRSITRRQTAGRAGEYERALSLDPYAVDPRVNLAVLLVRQDKLERAQSELLTVLRVEPGNASAHANLGVVLARRGQLDQAVREFQETLRLDPSQPQAAAALRAMGK